MRGSEGEARGETVHLGDVIGRDDQRTFVIDEMLQTGDLSAYADSPAEDAPEGILDRLVAEEHAEAEEADGPQGEPQQAQEKQEDADRRIEEEEPVAQAPRAEEAGAREQRLQRQDGRGRVAGDGRAAVRRGCGRSKLA